MSQSTPTNDSIIDEMTAIPPSDNIGTLDDDEISQMIAAFGMLEQCTSPVSTIHTTKITYDFDSYSRYSPVKSNLDKYTSEKFTNFDDYDSGSESEKKKTIEDVIERIEELDVKIGHLTMLVNRLYIKVNDAIRIMEGANIA